MKTLEEVIQALRRCLPTDNINSCDGCPYISYIKRSDEFACTARLRKDAIAYLKKQAKK